MAGEDRAGRTIGEYSAKIEGSGAQAPSTTGGLRGKKAIMFVPEGVDVTDKDLNIEVVALDAATFEAMGPRRC